tara:strand:+ start:5038 stop:5337 length:300 start_codon:yes stop_codon:yes gene_type:complete
MKNIILLFTILLSGCIIETDGVYYPARDTVVYYDDSSYEYTEDCRTGDYEYAYTEVNCFPGTFDVVLCHPDWIRPGCLTERELYREFFDCYTINVCEVW